MKLMKRGAKGFTLLEILIVLVILAVVAGLAVPAYISAVEKSRKSEALGSLGSIRSSADRYYAQRGTYVGMTYVLMDFDPTQNSPGANPQYTYGAPAGLGAAAWNVTATRNNVDVAAGSGCPANYTININQAGTITSTC